MSKNLVRVKYMEWVLPLVGGFGLGSLLKSAIREAALKGLIAYMGADFRR